MGDLKVLLVDVSNSFTKMAIGGAGKMGTVRRIATKTWTADRWRRCVREMEASRAVVSSVVPAVRALIEAEMPEAHFLGPNSPLGVGIRYPKPGTIGPDRLANAAAVAEIYGVPAIVVDFGTAVTLDIVEGDRCYVGGVIAPGLAAMTTYLHERTALLPKITLAEPRRAIGKSTVEAMRVGAVLGYRGMIRGLIEAVRAEVRVPVGGRLRVVATGGDARLLSRGLPEIEAVDSGLTLKGLGLVAGRLWGQ